MFRKTIASLVVILFVFTGIACAQTLDSSLSLFTTFAGLWTSVTAKLGQDYAYGRFFPAIYSDGNWISSYGISIDDYMAIQQTSADENALVTAITVVGRNGESSYFRKMCAFSWLILENPSDAIYDNVSDWLTTGAPMSDLSRIIETVDGKYIFSYEERTVGVAARITTNMPYVVDGYFEISTEGSYLTPFQQPTKNVLELERDMIQAMKENGYSEDDIMPLGIVPMDNGEYMHAYVLDYTMVGIMAASEDSDSTISNVVINNFQDDPVPMVDISQLVFAALTDMTQEDLISMYFGEAGETTWNDFLKKLPAVARDNKMLLFSERPDGSPGGYIMGAPGGEGVNSSR